MASLTSLLTSFSFPVPPGAGPPLLSNSLGASSPGRYDISKVRLCISSTFQFILAFQTQLQLPTQDCQNPLCKFDIFVAVRSGDVCRAVISLTSRRCPTCEVVASGLWLLLRE